MLCRHFGAKNRCAAIRFLPHIGVTSKDIALFSRLLHGASILKRLPEWRSRSLKDCVYLALGQRLSKQESLISTFGEMRDFAFSM